MIFISGNVPSSKNSKNAVAGKGVFHSSTVKKYLSAKGIQNYSGSKKTVKGYVSKPNLFRKEIGPLKEILESMDKPILLGFHFVRDSKRHYDFHNAVQIIFDLMVAHQIIEDDDTTNIYGLPYPIDGKFESHDKDKAGVFLIPLPNKTNPYEL